MYIYIFLIRHTYTHMCIYNDTCIYVNYFDVCMGAYAYCKHEYDVIIYFRFHHFTEWSTVFVLWGLLLEFVAVSHPSKTQFTCQEGTARSELEAQKAEILVLQTPWILLPKTNRNSHLKIGRNYPKTKRSSSNRIYFQVRTCCDFQGEYPPNGFNS